MTTTTPTPDAPVLDGVSRTRIEVRLDPSGGRVRVRTTSSGLPELPLLRPMLLDSDTTGARVSLVPEGAMLLAGDRIQIDVHVAAGARLDLVEPAGTVAYDMRGGVATWDVHAVLDKGAHLVWHGEPFVASAGSRTVRRTAVRMAPGSVLALRETLVLGRYGEHPGAVEQHLSVLGPDDVPLLVEELWLSPEVSAAVLGPHRVVGSVLLVGVTAPDVDPDHRYSLESGDTLWRRLASEAHLAAPADVWTEVVRSCARSAAAPRTPARAPLRRTHPG